MPDTYLVQCAACGADQRIPHDRTDAVDRCRACGARVIPSHSRPIQVTDAQWDAEMADSLVPAVVVVHSETCGTCAEYEASVRLMAVRLYGQARVLSLDIDRSPATAARYDVRGVPTVLLFRDGRLLASLSGPRGEQGLRERLGLG